MKKLFDPTTSDCTTILNLMFPTRLSQFRNKMIQSQYNDAKLRRSSWWRHNTQRMEALTDAEVRDVYEVCVATIEENAASASIELRTRFGLHIKQTKQHERSTEMRSIAPTAHQEEPVELSSSSMLASTTTTASTRAETPDASYLTRFASLTPFIDSRLTDVDIQNSLDTTRFTPYKTPQLLYRFYSAESAGLNSSKGIRASRFAMLNKYPVLGAPSVHEIIWDTSVHLSRCVMPTGLISASNNLVWVLHKLCKSETEGKRIAIIDGLAAQDHTAIYHSEKIVKELKARDMFQAKHVRTSTDGNRIVNTCKYTGQLEYFVYGEVSRRSIIQTISIEDLQDLIEQSTSVRQFFRLKKFMQATNLRALMIALAAHKLRLDRGVGIAIARIAHIFGLNYRCGTDMMVTFIRQMLHGWCIKVSKQYDRIKAVAHTFARVLSSALDTADRRESSELLSGAFETACQSCMKA